MSLMRHVTHIVVVLTLASAAGAAVAPVPVIDIRVLTADADVVVIGAVESVQYQEFDVLTMPGGRTMGVRWMRARIRVDQILKGEPTVPALEALEVRFAIDVPQGGYLGWLAEGTYQIVFLKLGTEGYEFASVYHPSVAAWPAVRAEGTDPEERVIRALASVLLSSAAPPGLKRSTIHVLWDIDHPPVVDALRVALGEDDPVVSLTAAAALLANGHMVALPLAETVLLRRAAGTDPVLLHNLRVGISEGVRSPEAISSLGRLLTSSDVETRRAAAAALRRMESMAALSALVRMLDDADFRVRLLAVQGLATLSEQRSLFPSNDAFRLNEASFVAPLRVWAAMHGVQ